MELVFYAEAAELLKVTIDTLVHAVSRGELTKAGLQGNRRLLIKEQVLLYTGNNPRTGKKKRISFDGLSEPEQALWHRYANDLQHVATDNTQDIKLLEQRLEALETRNVKKEVQQILTRFLATFTQEDESEVPQGSFLAITQ